MSLKSDLESWSKILDLESFAKLQDLQARAENLPDTPQALQKLAMQQGVEFLQGLEKYCHYDYPLFDYGIEPISIESACLYRLGGDFNKGVREGKPIVLVPSLVNRGYIMHLHKDKSFASYLQKHGLDVWILEWPDDDNIIGGMGFDDYMGLLAQAVLHVAEVCGGKPSLLGYCMGGIFTLGLSYLHGELIESQVLVGVPWDFSTYDSAYHRGLIEVMLSQAEGAGRVLSADMVAGYFWLINPYGSFEKFRNFGKLDMSSDAARRFVALEDWLNDGIGLSSALAERLCCDWYRDNLTGRGEFVVCGEALNLSDISIPSYVVIGSDDRIVPSGSSVGLVAGLGDVESVRVDLGHIGMMASGRAEEMLWKKIVNFLID